MKNFEFTRDPKNLKAFYCPNCQRPRRVPISGKPETALHVGQVLLTSLVFTVAGWSWFGWKGMVSIVPFWMGFEFIYRLRMRAHLPCPHCGFDPYLYLTDVKRARSEIIDFWKKKYEEKGVPYPGEGKDPENNSTNQNDANLNQNSTGGNRVSGESVRPTRESPFPSV